MTRLTLLTSNPTANDYNEVATLILTWDGVTYRTDFHVPWNDCHGASASDVFIALGKAVRRLEHRARHVEGRPAWCDCSEDHECEGHRA